MTTRALSNTQIARAAAVMLVGFLASGVLGLVRQAIIAGTFGASADLDAFATAQRLPEMLYTLVAGGALGSSFIPVFSRFLARDDTARAWQLASAVMTFSTLAAALLGLVMMVFAPFIVTPLVSQNPPEYQVLTIRLTQIMLLTTIVFTVSGLLMGILNAHQMFLLPSLALSVYNLGQIFGALVVVHLLPTESGLFATPAPAPVNVYGLALGAVLGALLHLAVQVPGLPRVRARLRILVNWRTEGVREVVTLMLPRVFGLGVVQINFLVSAYFANRMVDGSYAALTTAWYLMFFVLGLIAQSVGTAVFPSLSALAAEGDMAGFSDRLAGALRGVLFLALPASVGLIVLGRPIISLVFERAAWSAEATAGTAWALSFFALGIAGHSLLEVLSRAFYALSDTWTPVIVGLLSMVSNIVLNFILIRFVGNPDTLAQGAFGGLALAISITTLVESLGLWWLLSRRVEGAQAGYVVSGAARTLMAAAGMGVVVWGVGQVTAPAGPFVTAVVGMGVGIAAFFALALVLRVDEARTVPLLVLRRVRR